ncbi:MAG: hypothetical protein KAW84_04500 [Thermoplasmata archaeon]|nr:hypothetical protein [Thermoplasmata archaeon]
MSVDRQSVYRASLALLWTFCGATTMASFFFISFFPEYSPFGVGEIGFSIMFLPITVSFVVGLLVNEFDVPAVVLISILLVVISVVIAFLAVYSPQVSGIVVDAGDLPSSDEQRMSMVFSALFILPLTLIGTVLGKAVGAVVLPSEEELIERRWLIERTRKWHEALAARDEEPEESESRPEG